MYPNIPIAIPRTINSQKYSNGRFKDVNGKIGLCPKNTLDTKTATTAETNNGEGKTTGEETQLQVTAQPAEEKITISKKPAVKKLKAAKGRITVSWNKFKTKGKKNKAIWKKIKKIEVQCSTKKNFHDDETKKKTVGKTKKSVKFTSLKKKTTYYVRVRYCDGAGGFSKWSAVKKIKTK